MFANLKGLFSSTNKDLRKRILFTLGCLAIFALGTNIMVPGAKEITQNLGFLELLNLMSGGGLKSFSVFALGVGPYITASIITQLLQMDIIPYFKELKEQGATGRQKINRINRYLGIIFAVIQGYFFSYAFLKGAGTGVIIRSTIYLTAGTSFLLWLGDEITKGIIVGVIYMQQAERRVPIQYSNRTASAYGGEKSFIPIKLNSVSVIPVIFASAIIGIPSLIATVINKTAFTNFVDNYINYTSYTGFLLYMVLIFLFGYFYTLLELNPDEMAENLDKSRSYIPGVTPGEATSKYLKYVITRLTVVGTLGLMVIAALPIIFSKISNLSSNVTIGGTGLLIVVGVALETYKQLESSIVSRSYTGSAKRRRRR